VLKMNIQTFQQIIKDFQSRKLPKYTSRELKLPVLRDSAIAVTGGRRCGKTYRSFQYISELLQQGFLSDSICRIQFNDLRFRNMTSDDLPAIIDAFYSLYPDKRNACEVCFVFDEIHGVDGWEDFILGVLDDPLHRVLVTGSTSKLQQGDFASPLRGKCIPFCIYGFSFKEFLRHSSIGSDWTASADAAKIKHAFARYLSQGSYPALFDFDGTMHIDVLQNYWDTILVRDIIEAHPKENIDIVNFTAFAQSVISRIGSPLSVKSIADRMKASGLHFSPETLYRYMRYLEEAYAVFSVSIFTNSDKIKNRNYSKAYSVDWALAAAMSYSGTLGDSRLFENMVFIELKRRYRSLSYYKTRQGYEIDFVGVNQGRKPDLFQVCYQVTEECKERELRGIPETYAFLGAGSATVVTAFDEGELTINGVLVRIVPAWKWLLEN
jgi:predicted AAA+ superfamily ATPase